MILFLVLIVVLLLGLTTAAVMGKIGGFLADPASSQSFRGLPAGPLATEELAHLHFDQALRGYRMDQDDDVIDALSARVRELEAEVAPLADQDASPPEPDASPPELGDSHALNGDPPERCPVVCVSSIDISFGIQ